MALDDDGEHHADGHLLVAPVKGPVTDEAAKLGLESLKRGHSCRDRKEVKVSKT